MIKLPNFDDKDLAIISLMIIAVASVIVLDDPVTIIASSISAIAGIAVGRKLGNGNGEK